MLRCRILAAFLAASWRILPGDQLRRHRERFPAVLDDFAAAAMENGEVLPLMNGKESAAQRAAAPRGFPLKIVSFFLVFAFIIVGFYAAEFFGLSKVMSPLELPGGAGAAVTVAPCNAGLNSVQQWAQPKLKLIHNMSDEELFWAASFEPRVNKYPFRRRPKIAFMFLTRGPLPLAPLWEKFFDGNAGMYSVYIHSLPGYEQNVTRDSVFYGRQIPSQVAEWGEMSICDAERRLLANALLDLSNERFVLLSESCIPLFSFGIVYRYLLRSRHSHVGAFDDPGPYGRGRYSPAMAPEVNISQWRKGAQWFEVDRRLAVDIVADAKYYPKFKNFCRPACYVDEHYFPTMLSIESPERIANRTLTWVDWSRGGAHPASFGEADVSEEFVKGLAEGQQCMHNGQPSTVCYLFARKFAPSALGPLLRLAPRLLGFGR